ncbi:MAG: HlyD family efflux transporter periplasmic adaptor subunit [Bacteroidetes bacterium]|nr:HlyD family efflux transporter periplasmic adaptor subunit [Bacteroidota bacterium]
MKQTILRALAGLVILTVGVMVMNALIGMKGTPPVKPRASSARMVKAMNATSDTLAPEVRIEGRVQALNRMTVLSEVNGMLPVGGKEFREGVAFAAGEAMLRLDDAELRASLVAQRSQWLQLLAGSLADLQVDFPDRAGVWMDYVKSLRVESRLAELPEPATDRERLYLTSRGIVSGYHNIRANEERLDKFTVRAPFDGIVVGAQVQPGSMVRAGQPLGTLVGTGTFEVKSAVHARHLARLSEGDAVTLLDESEVVVAQGRVARISGNVDPTTQSASVFCEVSETPGQPLRDGRFLSGVVFGDKLEGVMALNEALLEGNGSQVYVIRDGKLDLADVEVVHRDADVVLVRGLEPGTKVLAEPISGAYVGLLVDLVQR